MLQTLRKRFERDEEGFTLIELMVVVLIIAILLAIAIPTFLGARERAQDRAAQSNARNAYTAAKTIYTDTQNWTQLTLSGLKAAEPSLGYVVGNATAASSGEKVIAVNNSAEQTVTLAVKSTTGKCFILKEITVNAAADDEGTYYGSHSNASCVADPAAATGTKW